MPEDMGSFDGHEGSRMMGNEPRGVVRYRTMGRNLRGVGKGIGRTDEVFAASHGLTGERATVLAISKELHGDGIGIEFVEEHLDVEKILAVLL